MPRFAWVASIVLLLGMTLPAEAHFGILSRPRPMTAYYLAVPVVPVYAAPVVCVPVAVPIAPARPYAQPQLAPPSAGKEPPLAEPAAPVSPAPAKPGPERPVARVANYFDAYAVAPGTAARPANGRSSVSFWNLTPQELVLKIGDRRVSLAAGRSATLDLEREFTWRIEGREAQTSRVAANESALEIVIRR